MAIDPVQEIVVSTMSEDKKKLRVTVKYTSLDYANPGYQNYQTYIMKRMDAIQFLAAIAGQGYIHDCKPDWFVFTMTGWTASWDNIGEQL